MKDVINEIGAEINFDKVQRPRKIVRERSTRRNIIITLSNEWDVRIVLAKSSEKRTKMKEMGKLIPVFSDEDAERYKFEQQKTPRTLE